MAKPQYLRDERNLVGGFVIRHVDNDAFEEYGIAFAVGLERPFDLNLRVGFGSLIEFAQTEAIDSAG